MNEIRSSEGTPMKDIRIFVEANKYPVPKHPITSPEEKPKQNPERYMSRCIDGRYKGEPGLPALAIPGADIGQMVMLFAAANKSGVDILNSDKVENPFVALETIVGGVENIRIHTAGKNTAGIAKKCGYFEKVKEDPEAFGITGEQVAIIEKEFENFLRRGAKQIVLEGKHEEQDLLVVSGEFSVYPEKNHFVFHKTLVAERNNHLVELMFEGKNKIRKSAFKIALNKISSDKSETDEKSQKEQSHLIIIKDKIAHDAPVIGIDFAQDGSFEITQLAA